MSRRCNRCERHGLTDVDFRDIGRTECTECLNERCREYSRTPRGRAQSRSASRQATKKRRLAVLVMLGGVCNRCGFTDARALQIDHIHGRGGVRQHPSQLARAVLAGEVGYQLLCANCNWIKRSENDEGPKRVRESEWDDFYAAREVD